jgi:tetratricopeptide (TPR) repeat protein
VTYPDHPLIAAAYLEMGNLEAAAGKWPEAVNWYERLLRDLPRSAAATEAYYNLGLARQQLGEGEAARNSFYWVVDRAPGHRLTPLAYLHVGRLHLEEGDAQGAVRPLRRAVTPMPGWGTRAAAALLLAAASLLSDNPRAAHATLVEFREEFGQEPYRGVAAFLDALACYRAVPDPGRAARQAQDLLTALLALKEDPVLGPVGRLLAGQAYRDLGMGDRMAALFEKAAAQVRGPLLLAMNADLAEYLYASGQRPAARQRFEALAAATGPHALRAEMRLAELDVLDRQPDECLKRCRKLLRENRAADVPALLRLMGKAYDQKGEYGRAARCYAGQVPDA